MPTSPYDCQWKQQEARIVIAKHFFVRISRFSEQPAEFQWWVGRQLLRIFMLLADERKLSIYSVTSSQCEIIRLRISKRDINPKKGISNKPFTPELPLIIFHRLMSLVVDCFVFWLRGNNPNASAAIVVVAFSCCPSERRPTIIM